MQLFKPENLPLATHIPLKNVLVVTFGFYVKIWRNVKNKTIIPFFLENVGKYSMLFS